MGHNFKDFFLPEYEVQTYEIKSEKLYHIFAGNDWFFPWRSSIFYLILLKLAKAIGEFLRYS